ncbi:MAG TPA: FAD-dependent monooxygenase [Vicinamibacterales bacterium]|nr:FAD-dependent monooxygenase [Vicinamibacterales bacterium]
MTPDYDVVIAGGGLAGLTLARQLRQEAPALRVFVAEGRTHPVPEAAFKVGESTVEIAAHYFHTRLGLAAHLRDAQLEKLGLRYFFPSDGNRDIAARFELGPTTFPAVPSFQLDRGRFENMLLAANRDAGVDVEDGCRVTSVELGAPHRVDLATPHGTATRTARWFVDATGRHGLLRRRLGLDREVGHGAHACWFRFPQRLKVDDWSADPAWRARVPTGERWLSTNHLMGVGYWVWLIPLGSGSTSVGIVADDRLHPYGRLNRFDRAVDWLREFEPQCADVVEAHRGDLQDFLGLKHFAHGCRQVYSRERWALVGEAGPFTDPFYSPGSDFIAMGNDFTADLIRRECAGEAIASRAEAFDTTYLRLYDAFLRLYEGQYPLMGDAQVMTSKIAWDNACYWGITGLLFYQGRLRDPAFLISIDGLMRRFFVLHARMQQYLRAWHDGRTQQYAAGTTSPFAVEWLQRLQQELGDAPLDDDALRGRLHGNLALLHRFAAAINQLAAGRDRPGLDRLLPIDGVAPVDIDAFRLAPLASARTL